MKPRVAGRVATQLTCMLFLLSPGARTIAGSDWQYLSPAPGSSLNFSSTTIILRPGPLVDRASLGQKHLLKVTGSISAIHAGRLLFSDDLRTIIFRPLTPFASGESVTVTCGPGLKGASGELFDPITFQFCISSGRVNPADIQQFLAPEGRIGREFDPGHTLRKSPMFQHSTRTDSLPSGFPALSLATSQDPTPGYIYLSNFPFQTTIPNTPYLMTVDTSGHPVFYREENNVCLDFKLQPTGLLTYFDRSFGYDLALDSTGAVVDSFTCGNGYYTDEHDLRLLPNGHALLLGDDFETIRMDTIVAGGDSNASVEGIVIQELDNGNFHTPEFSRAVEYHLDEQLKTATLVWQFRNSPDIYGSAMGYVQRLDDGNTLIGWGAANPSVTEVRPDGSKAFELTLPEGVFSYRAYKFGTPLLLTEVGRVAGGLPSGYRLEQNYPNPFNPQTTIAFSVPVRSHVFLNLYNALGQRISTLLDGELLPGQHSVRWDAESYPSGAYFYRLQAQASAATTSTAGPTSEPVFDVTRKMLLVR